MRASSALRTFVVGLVLAAATATGLGPVAAQPAAPPPPSTDPFREWSAPLTDRAPGEILRSRPVPYGAPGLATPIASTQVLYRTTDQQDRPAVTVATVLRPLVPGPTRMISFHTAYDGLGPDCNPSWTLTGRGTSETAVIEQGLITGYLAAGYTVVVPDYEGEQSEWTIGRQSGYAALDGIRAAQSFLSLPPSTPVGMIGYSGGSVPTQWGAEVAPTYAPELALVGAAAGGLPVNLAHNLPYVSGSAGWAGVMPALVVAYQRTYGFDTDAFLSEEGRAVTAQVQDRCIAGFAASYPGLTDAAMVRPPYRSLLDVPAVVAAVGDNVMGTAGTPRIPMFLAVGDIDGTGDSVMITADVRDLAGEYCDRGVPVVYHQYDGASHTDAFPRFEADAAQFLADRFAGTPTATTCA
ncbi:lipase family protein [Rhodococcoides corynebacterioides]|uniref:lipase family protein n=1 Tax=Rhodococcoides corynebacterioides TaxID=53972 RepID=UPI0035302BA2